MFRPWQRPMYGPFRRTARPGVPADHFPKASEMGRYGDGRSVLVADGPATAVLMHVLLASGHAFVVGDAGDLVELTAWAATAEFHTCDRPDDAPLDQEWTCECGEVWPPIPEHLMSHPSVGLATTSSATLPDEPAVPDSPEGLEARLLHARERQRLAAQPAPAPRAPKVAALGVLGEAQRRALDPDNEITDPDALRALVASAFDARGGLAAWTALRERNGITAATNADGVVEPAEFHAYLCAEGIRTDEGRELLADSCRFPDLPVSMRVLIEDEGGHWGAVTCGRIDLMDRRAAQGLSMIYSEGAFGSDENGQLGELLVEEQTQRFVSVDLRDMTGQWVEVVVSVERYGDGCYDDDCVYDCWYQVQDCVIGAATIVAMAALPQAVITLKSVALPESPITIENAPAGLDEIAEAVGITAAAGAPPGGPSSEYFASPGFHVGDARLVRQPDGHYACPTMTSEPDGDGWRRTFGHVAYWGAKHTGFPGANMNPPRSASGYAYYMIGACPCSDPECEHAVGQITMGCGHAPLTKASNRGPVQLAAHEVKAHYDGGYGAVQVADIVTGEDDFGIWFSGAVRRDITDDQLREFMAMGVSGDWREMAGSLDLLAVLSVPVPGFPIARRAALAASGAPGVIDAASARLADHDGKVFALVAAGVVRRVPEGERIARLEAAVDALVTLEANRARAALRASIDI